MTNQAPEESALVPTQAAAFPLLGRLPISGLEEKIRFLPESDLEVALMELQKWEEGVEVILRSHRPVVCQGLNGGYRCEICKSKHDDSEYGLKVRKYYQKRILNEPLWKEQVGEDEGFDPYEVEAAIAVNITQNPDDPMERSHDRVYNSGEILIDRKPITREIYRAITGMDKL